jgi:hypothetical protein
MRRRHKTRWLLSINIFIEVTMEKDIFDVKLMNEPIFEGSNASDIKNGAGLDNLRKQVVSILV